MSAATVKVRARGAGEWRTALYSGTCCAGAPVNQMVTASGGTWTDYTITVSARSDSQATVDAWFVRLNQFANGEEEVLIDISSISVDITFEPVTTTTTAPTTTTTAPTTTTTLPGLFTPEQWQSVQDWRKESLVGMGLILAVVTAGVVGEWRHGRE